MVKISFKTLNKDIKLVHKTKGLYDRKLQSGDFVLVDEKEALQSGILLKMLTFFGELPNNPTYKEWGNKTQSLLKANKTPVVVNQIRDYTVDVLKSMRRVKSVEYVNITHDFQNSERIFVEWAITCIDDTLLEGGIVI